MNEQLDNVIFKLELLYLNLEDFLGFARIMGIDIEDMNGEENKNRHIRNDFEVMESLMLEKYNSLNKTEKNKILRRLRQITKYYKKNKEVK